MNMWYYGYGGIRANCGGKGLKFTGEVCWKFSVFWLATPQHQRGTPATYSAAPATIRWYSTEMMGLVRVSGGFM